MSGIIREPFTLKESIVTILSRHEKYNAIAKRTIAEQRRLLEAYIAHDGFFNVTFEPYEPPAEAPDIVKRMCSAADKAGVGPMAAVAGTIAAYAVEAMSDAGASYAIVDNGGDIAFINDTPITIGIYAGEASPIKNIAFKIEPRDRLLGICTSSSTVGPSISLGKADAAVVISEDVSLADAAATALGNAVRERTKEAVENAFTLLEKIKEIEGALIIAGEHVGMWGELPEIVRAGVDRDLITKG